MTTAQWAIWGAMTVTSFGFLIWFVRKMIEEERDER